MSWSSSTHHLRLESLSVPSVPQSVQRKLESPFLSRILSIEHRQRDFTIVCIQRYITLGLTVFIQSHRHRSHPHPNTNGRQLVNCMIGIRHSTHKRRHKILQRPHLHLNERDVCLGCGILMVMLCPFGKQEYVLTNSDQYSHQDLLRSIAVVIMLSNTK